MGREKTSRTEEDSFFEERIIGTHHYKTTISDDRHRVEVRGNTAEEAEERASEEWDRLYGDDEDED